MKLSTGQVAHRLLPWEAHTCSRYTEHVRLEDPHMKHSYYQLYGYKMYHTSLYIVQNMQHNITVLVLLIL